MRSAEHSIFYVYLDFEQRITIKGQLFRELGLYGKFIN